MGLLRVNLISHVVYFCSNVQLNRGGFLEYIEFGKLSYESKCAVLLYFGYDAGDFGREDIVEVSDFEYRVEMVRMDEAKRRCMSFPFDAGEFDSFEEYHEWYIGCHVEDHGDSVFPVIEWNQDEWLYDGWHRFHSYVRRGFNEIPVLTLRRKN